MSVRTVSSRPVRNWEERTGHELDEGLTSKSNSQL